MSDVNVSISGQPYQQFLAEIVNMVQHHRIIAVQSVQNITNTLYWEIGEHI